MVRPTAKQAAKAGADLLEARQPSKPGTTPDPAALSRAAKTLSSRRLSKMTPKQRTAVASNAAKAYWDSMSARERKIEVKRRAAIRKKRRREALKEKVRAGK